MWGSLKRAADGHWGEEATVDPEGEGFKVTLHTTEHIPTKDWGTLSRFMRGYAQASHWKLSRLRRYRTHAEFFVEYTPPKTKKKNAGREAWKQRQAAGRVAPKTA